MSDETMVERLRQIISEARAEEKSDAYIARAAIQAMREPTEAMLLAGERAEELGDSPAYKHWRAMIDAALSPQPDTKK